MRPHVRMKKREKEVQRQRAKTERRHIETIVAGGQCVLFGAVLWIVSVVAGKKGHPIQSVILLYAGIALAVAGCLIWVFESKRKAS